jgi:hypothetical protein
MFHLHLPNNKGTSELTLPPDFTLPRLTHLSIEVDLSCDPPIGNCPTHLSKTFIAACPELRHLKIAVRDDPVKAWKEITDDNESVKRNLLKVEGLKFKYDSDFDDEDVYPLIAKSCPVLKSLELAPFRDGYEFYVGRVVHIAQKEEWTKISNGEKFVPAPRKDGKEDWVSLPSWMSNLIGVDTKPSLACRLCPP